MKVTIIIGVVHDDAKWKITLDEEIVQQEQLSSNKTQYFHHSDTFSDKEL